LSILLVFVCLFILTVYVVAITDDWSRGDVAIWCDGYWATIVPDTGGVRVVVGKGQVCPVA